MSSQKVGTMQGLIVDFMGGASDKQHRVVADEAELDRLGYRAYLTTRDKAGEIHTLAVPLSWTEDEASWAILEKMSFKSLGNPVMW
ncbi:hypothetical protein CFN79_16920 [Chromobacterium vaccinii]|uniref:Uncharacterized protein n=2 Tax=Neisseriales TaxID=206351 RepID=A0ABN0N9X9_9NEIS|nr:hypothetical protein CFN79_16920 [Chromobacterium vaccinii]ERE14032.1 hypothetical protein O166_00280 [Pseudogulbenkiania ferrooxidans EGD-HP2]